jgi:asparagine synthase (glutamine-hydrolysing)
MCGFVGILTQPGRPVDAELLGAMAHTIRHRGPDGEGQLIDERVALHHKRLAIIDLATGQQPMTSGPFTIVFNGEIYNYVELREDLRRRGHEFRTQSDTEVILRLYAEHGEGCVKLLNGMFAFLLYDRERGIVLAARDHFGVKPLYYAEIAGQLCYASEIKALLRHPEATRAPHTQALHDYLTFQFVLGDATLFQGVRKVLPGHYQVVNLATLAVRTEKYWEPTFRLDPYHTEEYFIGEVRRLLNDAVRLQMRSDVPVGCYLSGGMDSSLVTLLAAPHVGGRLHTFSGAFKEGPEFNELEYAREVARTCGAESHEVFPTELEFVDLLPTLVYHMDEPVAGPGLFPQYVVSRMAQKQVKVCLGGQGGDEIFGGYTRYLVAYFEQALKGAIFETNEEQEHIVSLRSIVPNLAALKQYVPMLKQFWNDELFPPMDRRYFRLIDRSGGALGLLSDDFRAGYDPDALFARFQQVFNHPETASYYNKMTHFDMVTTLPALLQVEDRVSMAVSLESRVPLLDHRLADLVASMPPAMKFRGGEMKYILKRAVQHTLPKRILERKDKMGFPVPLHLWTQGRARDFFHDILLSQRCRERGIFNPAEVRQLLGKEEAFGRRLWGLLNLELWHRQFMDAD